MQRHWLKVLTVVAIGAGAAACDRPAPITSPQSAAAPRAAITTSGYTLGGWYLFTGSGNASQTKSVVIDQGGGKINFGANSLVVPYMAVSGPTRFTFTLQTQPFISAKLTAVSVTSVRNQWVDGAKVTVFARPLTLTLSYAGAKQDVPDPTALKILWLENGVIMGVLPAQPDVKGKKVITEVTHFTDYTPGVPGPNPCNPETSLFGCGDNTL